MFTISGFKIHMDAVSALSTGLAPRGIAVYGATSRAGAMGSILANRLLTGTYNGEIVLVNARPQEIFGRKAVTSAVGCGAKLDTALIVVPANAVEAAIEDAASAGIGLAVVLSSGFSEVGDEGILLEGAVRAAAACLGIRLIGPNCLGFINYNDDVVGSPQVFSQAFAGGVSVIGQSGSVAGRIAAYLAEAQVGLDIWISIGNAVDLDAADYIDFLARREETRVIILYLEGLKSIDRLRAAIKAARVRGKEIVVLKSGRSEAGACSAASHTGATSSKDVFVDIFLRDVDAIRAESPREACDIATILIAAGRLSGKAAIVGPSGGDCTLAADRCSDLDIPLAVISKDGQASMKSAIPLCATQNPIDPTPMAFQDGKFERLLEVVGNEKDVGYLVFLTANALMLEQYSSIAAPAIASAGKRGLPIVIGAPVSSWARDVLENAKVAIVSDIDRVFAAVGKVLTRADLDDVGGSSPTAMDENRKVPQLMGELDALVILGRAGIPMVETIRISEAAGLQEILDRLGYPIVLKGIVPDIGHKSGLGLVKLNLQNESQVFTAFSDLQERVSQFPGSKIIAQPAIQGSLAELIIGVVDDPMFGMHVTVGMGGIWTDFLNERVWAKAPVSRDEASRMLDNIAIGRGLKGGRKGIVTFADGVIDALVGFSNWAAEFRDSVEEAEINPLIVRRHDVVAVDALIALKPAGSNAFADMAAQRATEE